MCRKILLLFPESCRNLGRLDNDPSGRITHVDDVEVRKDRAGVVGRVYKNTIYSVTSKEGEVSHFTYPCRSVWLCYVLGPQLNWKSVSRT